MKISGLLMADSLSAAVLFPSGSRRREEDLKCLDQAGAETLDPFAGFGQRFRAGGVGNPEIGRQAEGHALYHGHPLGFQQGGDDNRCRCR